MASAGHPTKQRQLEMDETIRFYFERDIGIWECNRKTGLSFRTVKARYNKFAKLLENQHDKKFLTEQERSKRQALTAFDKQLIELINIQQQILQGVDKAQKEAKDANRPMEKKEIQPDIRAKLSWMIGDMTDKKAGLEMTPTVAEKVRKEVKDYIEKFQQQDYTEQIKRANS